MHIYTTMRSRIARKRIAIIGIYLSSFTCYTSRLRSLLRTLLAEDSLSA